ATPPSAPRGAMELMDQWKIHDALETYGVRNWGKGYFGVNDKGHVTVHPNKNPDQAIDLKDLVDQLQERGIQLPILIRFTDILRHRVGEIFDAFKTAIAEYNYLGNYTCVYPIKVNQQRHVVEEILDFGKPYKFGLTLTEALEAFEYLKQRGMEDCLQLVHFHLGSQVSNIRSIKNALTEAARVYVELHRVGAGVKYIDVGGGLGIDYDGSQTDF